MTGRNSEHKNDLSWVSERGRKAGGQLNPARLEREQRALRKRVAKRPHPGPSAKVKQAGQTGELDERVMVAIILLRRGVSPALVAIDKKVRLPIEQVQCYADVLSLSGLLNQQDARG